MTVGSTVPPTWLTLVNRVDEAIRGDMVQCGDKQNEPSSESSEGHSGSMGISLDLMMILVVMRSVFIPIYCSLPPCKMKEVRTYNWRETPSKCHLEVMIISSMGSVSIPPSSYSA